MSVDVQPTIDNLFVRVRVPVRLRCPVCGHAREYDVPGIVDWRDREAIEWLRATTPSVPCHVCGTGIALRRPVVVRRPGDPVPLVAGFPEDTPLEEDQATLTLLLDHPDLGDMRVHGLLPVRLDDLGQMADRYSGFALAGVDDGGDRDGGNWQAWIESIHPHVVVPPLAAELSEFVRTPGEAADAFATASRGLLDPAWGPVVDVLFTQLMNQQTDIDASEIVRRRFAALRRLRSGDTPPSGENTLDAVTRELLDVATRASAASSPEHPHVLWELIARLRGSPQHRVLLAGAMISYVAVASSPPWRTPESLERAIEVGAEVMDIAAEAFGAHHPVTLTAIQDHAATLLDQQRGPGVTAQRRAMALLARVAAAAVESGNRDLSDVLQNWAAAFAHHTAGDRIDNQEIAVRLFRDALHVHRVLRPHDARGALVIRLNTAAALRERRTGNVVTTTRQAIEEYRDILRSPAVDTILTSAEIAQGWANFVTAQLQLRQIRPGEVTIEDVTAAAGEAAERCQRLVHGDPVRIGALSNVGSVLGDLYQDTYRAGAPQTDLLDLGIRLTGEANDDARRYLGDAHEDRIRIGQNHVANLARPHPDRDPDVTTADAVLRELLALATADHLRGHRYSVASNLGRLHAGAGRWHDAIGGFEIALDAAHGLYGRARTAESRLAELGVAADVAGWLAILRLVVHDVAGAVTMLERSRARLLTDGSAGVDGKPPATRRPVLYVGAGALGSWVILTRPGEPPFGVRTTLTSDELRPLVNNLRLADKHRLAGAIDAVTAVLGSAILQPVRLLIDELRLTVVDVVTSGLLSGLPLHALPADPATGECWLHQATIRYIPSATIAAGWSAWNRRGGPVLAYADRTSGLDCAAQEPAMIPARLGDVMPVPVDGDLGAWLLDALQRAGHAHLACHAYWDQDDPLRSTVKLGGTQMVTLAQVLALDCRALDLAVLSCCSTGVPVEVLSDELVGFGTGMFIAGARASVVSSWGIDDLASSLVMAAFYRGLDDGIDPGRALRSAQLQIAALTTADLEQLWQESSENRPGALLPPGLAAQAVPLIMLSDPAADDRPFRHPAHWAGYSYHGPAPAGEEDST